VTGALLSHHRTMARIRAFEERVGRHFREGHIHGFVHTSIGQEAIAAGVCATLDPRDTLTTTHRGHGHCLAKGADPAEMMAELFGRATGTCHGRGGSMHLADPSLGILGANGIVGAGIPIAVGAALAAKTRATDEVAVAFFGEGAVHCGAFHEALVLAVAWQVPIVFVCENNGFAEFTETRIWGGPEPAKRARGYGVRSAEVDGNDVLAVERAAAKAVGAARRGGGPQFLEARTYRVSGHYEGDATPYRDAAEHDRQRESDPLRRSEAQLERAGEGEVAAKLREEAEAEMDAAVAFALEQPYPDPSTVLEHILD
jgi:TPP-dependent pyruvate/acetoin dehydrogenase alpha subunit